MCVLTCDAELSREIRDGEPLAPQQGLPNLGFMPHGDDRSPFRRQLRP
jgi:hypothetical protein